jgi:hypothetical protein
VAANGGINPEWTTRSGILHGRRVVPEVLRLQSHLVSQPQAS